MDPINQRRGVHGLGQLQARPRPARIEYILRLVECAFAHQNIREMEKQLKARLARLKLGWSWVCGRCPALPGPARPAHEHPKTRGPTQWNWVWVQDSEWIINYGLGLSLAMDPSKVRSEFRSNGLRPK